MLRRARAWASAEISRLLHTEIDGARTDLEASMHARVAQLADGIDHEARERERTLTESFDRVAASLDAIAVQLAEQARDHRASLAAIECLAREMTLALVAPAAAVTTATVMRRTTTATVVGGTIDPQQIDPYAMDTRAIGTATFDPTVVDATADATAANAADTGAEPLELDVGCIVEVRSRFQNRWVDGFEIVEILDDDGVTRYRLARRADHVHLPVLFDASDLRPLDVVGEIVIELDVDLDLAEGADAEIDQPRVNRGPDDPGSRR